MPIRVHVDIEGDRQPGRSLSTIVKFPAEYISLATFALSRCRYLISPPLRERNENFTLPCAYLGVALELLIRATGCEFSQKIAQNFTERVSHQMYVTQASI